MKKFAMVLLLVALCSVGYGVTDGESYSQWMQQGKKSVVEGNLQEAKESFENALLFKPNDAEAQKGIRMTEERIVKRAPAPQPKASVKAGKKKDQKDFSIRIALGNAPGIDEGEILGSTFSIEDDAGGQLELLAVKRFWSKNNPNIGGVLGGGVFFAGNSGTDPEPPPTDFDIAAFGIMGEGGVVAKLGDYVVVEAMPYLGIGGASVEITGFTDGGAAYFMYGIKGGLFVLLGDSVELGLEVGYHGFSSEVELEDPFSGATADLTLSGSGPRVAAVLAIKF